jgi:hypothetical protein
MNTEGNSRIYVINPESGETEKYVSLIEVDGDGYTGHCGGIATFEGNAWVVSGKYARRLSLDALRDAENELMAFQAKYRGIEKLESVVQAIDAYMTSRGGDS